MKNLYRGHCDLRYLLFCLQAKLCWQNEICSIDKMYLRIILYCIKTKKISNTHPTPFWRFISTNLISIHHELDIGFLKGVGFTNRKSFWSKKNILNPFWWYNVSLKSNFLYFLFLFFHYSSMLSTYIYIRLYYIMDICIDIVLLRIKTFIMN